MLKTYLTAATVAIAAVVAATPVSASTFLLSGDTTRGPTYNRVLANGNNAPTGTSAVGTAVAYNTLLFSVDTTETYSFLLTSTEAGYDPFLTLYSGIFNASSPLAGALIANDDFQGSTSLSGFSYALVAGQVYSAVVAGFDNGDFGTYTLRIAPAAAAVPEPASWALLIGGFGALGTAMRRKSTVRTTVRFA